MSFHDDTRDLARAFADRRQHDDPAPGFDAVWQGARDRRRIHLQRRKALAVVGCVLAVMGAATAWALRADAVTPTSPGPSVASVEAFVLDLPAAEVRPARLDVTGPASRVLDQPWPAARSLGPPLGTSSSLAAPPLSAWSYHHSAPRATWSP